jgi:hypothetical protein
VYRIELLHIKARIERLHQLTINLGKEIVAQRDAEGLLLPLERRRYLDGLQDGLAALDAARVVLVGVVGRMENPSSRRLTLARGAWARGD